MSQRVMRPFNGGCSTCGGGGSAVMLGPPPVVEGVEVSPAPLLSAPPTLIEPAPAAPASPMNDPAPIELDPIGSGANPTSKSEVGQTSHQAIKPRGNVSTARRDVFKPAPPSADPLAGFTPRLEAPTGALAADPASAGVPPPADQVKLPGPEPGPTDSPPSPAENTTTPDPTPTSNANPTESAGGQVSLAPGFRSFVDVAPRIAGGSLPTANGWQWLAQQGFRTVLDLRPSADVRREDIAAINSSGLRYVSLPVETESIDDPKMLARFASEIGQEPAQPLFFFDTDGARASVMWYLHDVVNRNAAADSAAQKADEFGPRDPALWSKARAYLDRLNPPDATPGTTENIDPPPGPVPDLDPSLPKLKATARDLAEKAVRFVAARWNATDSAPETPAPHDPNAWRPYAALAAAGLSVPLAFLSRSALGHVGNRVLASLPAPGRSPKQLPSSSDG